MRLRAGRQVEADRMATPNFSKLSLYCVCGSTRLPAILLTGVTRLPCVLAAEQLLLHHLEFGPMGWSNDSLVCAMCKLLPCRPSVNFGRHC